MECYNLYWVTYTQSYLIMHDLHCTTVCEVAIYLLPQIATKNRVFLFDILALGALAFKNGLTKILANDRILKVL